MRKSLTAILLLALLGSVAMAEDKAPPKAPAKKTEKKAEPKPKDPDPPYKPSTIDGTF